MTNKDFLKHFRDEIHKEKLVHPKGFFFDKQYYEYMRKEGYERHHTIGRAYSDYWIVNLKSDRHGKIRDVKEPFNADVFVETLQEAWINLVSYYKNFQLSVGKLASDWLLENYKIPKIWFKLITTIK